MANSKQKQTPGEIYTRKKNKTNLKLFILGHSGARAPHARINMVSRRPPGGVDGYNTSHIMIVFD